MNSNNSIIHQNAVGLLKKIISIPSFSKEEAKTADLFEGYFKEKNIKCYRKGHNVWAYNSFFDPKKMTLLLNSHHDTVKPNAGYTKDPFFPIVENDKLYGLGSNDAGGALVSLLSAFLHFYNEKLSFNICFLASAEEENSGKGGIESVLNDLTNIDCAIVGEPTEMNLAIAERGLLVLDCVAKGKAGHAAREEGINAIYQAIDDINWFKSNSFTKTSQLLGPIKMTVTAIDGGNLHNMVPDECKYTVDIRINELYTHEEIFSKVKASIKSEVTPRSMRLKSSMISQDHPLVRAALKTGGKVYGSPTLSDKALLPFPALKIGPGKSVRSHTSDEYILISEIQDGISKYIQLLKHFNELSA